MADTHLRDCFLIEYSRISEANLRRADNLIFLNATATVWMLHDTEHWKGMLVVRANPLLDRRHYQRGKIVNLLKREDLADYQVVPTPRIDRTLEDFLKRPDVVALSTGVE